MKWIPHRRKGLLIGGGIIALILLVDVVLVWRVIRGPINGLTFVCALLVVLSLGAIGLVAYRMANLARLRYEFDRNRFVIETAAGRQTIPMDRIERVIDARTGDLRVRVRGLHWPGCSFGQGYVRGLGLVLFYAVDRLSTQAIVVTPALAYGISPPDMDTFREVFEACQRLGPSAQVEHASVRSPWTRWAIWNDRVAQGVLLGSTLLCALLFAVLCFRYPRLPALLSMHYDAAGQVDRVAPRSEVFDLPVIALMIWTVNNVIGAVLYRRQRVLSYLAWSGTLVVQVFFFLALWNIVT